MNPNQALWEKGDFTQISSLAQASGERRVASLGVVPSLRVLDPGCGDGTTAVPLARLGAQLNAFSSAQNTAVDGGIAIAATFMKGTVPL